MILQLIWELKDLQEWPSMITTFEIKQIGIPRAAFEYVNRSVADLGIGVEFQAPKKTDNTERHDATATLDLGILPAD